jgi:nucleoside phosphorylase
MQDQRQPFDICIVCALYEEAQAVLNEFSTLCGVFFTKAFSSLDRYEYRHTAIHNFYGESLTVLVTWLSNSGPTQTGLDLKPFLLEFRPRFVAMTGICAGDREKVKLGDIVVAEYAYHYEEGKIIAEPDGSLHHLPGMQTAASTSQVIHYLHGFEGWKEPLREMMRHKLNRQLRAKDEPRCVIAPMASGMAVRQDNPFPWLKKKYNRNTTALDMEAASFYRTLRAVSHIHGLVVKGVCDYADMTKNDAYHDYAARASAVYLLYFIQEYVTEQTMPRRDVPSAAVLPGPPPLLPAAKIQYRSWLSANTATFSIPGPTGVLLPIATAWTRLHVLNKQNAAPQQDIEELVRRYHEWEQLASRADDNDYDAIDVAEIGWRVVVTGGPGAGKSTLCRKLAHDLTELDEVVMWISLPAFANRLHNGLNINTALIETATDGLDLPLDVRTALLTQADCLVADGLDECGDLVVSVAEDLQRWATAHPLTRVVITSRPIGYEIKYFPEWEHYDLMPLRQDQLYSASWVLIQALAPDVTLLDKQAAWFHEQLKHNHVATLAARNPLLLGFLVQLSLRGEALAQERAGLYEQILNLWREARPQGRTWQIRSLDALLTWRALEILGWLFLSSEKAPAASSHDKLVQQLSQQLAREKGTHPLQESTAASDCLHFWHERGVLDRLHAGHQEIYTFVHSTFREYAAGRYLASLNRSEIRQWVRNKYDDARWREPIVLASGCGAAEVVVETLLEIEADDEQAASLLFSALAESPTAPDRLTTLVADRLIAHLISHNAALPYAVAEQGMSLVKRIPDLFAPLLQPLLAHHQIWTRLAATDLALASGPECVEIEKVEQLLKDVMSDPIDSLKPMEEEKKDKLNAKGLRGWLLDANDGWGVQNDVIVRGAEVIARRRPDAATKELLQALYLSSAISAATHGKLSLMLIELGCQEFVEQHQAISQKDIRNWLNKGRKADQKMLETILRITQLPDSQPKKRRKLITLTTLIYALNVPKAGVNDWDILSRLDDVTAIEAVLRGFIRLYRIDAKELGLDAAWALEKVQEGLQSENSTVSLLRLLPRVPIQLHVAEEIDMNVSTQELFRALKHPSAIIAYGAGWLLVVGGRRKELEALLREMKQEINNNGQMKEILVRIVPFLWGNDVPTWLSSLLKPNGAIEAE